VVLDGDHDGVAQAARAPDIALVDDAMARRVELRGLVGVDVQQRAGLAPLKALERLARAAATARDAVALEHPVDRPAVPADQRRQTHRPPVGASAGIEDDPLLGARQRPRTRPRDRTAWRTPHAAGALSLRRPTPPIARRDDRRRRTTQRESDRPRRLPRKHPRDHLTPCTRYA